MFQSVIAALDAAARGKLDVLVASVDLPTEGWPTSVADRLVNGAPLELRLVLVSRHADDAALLRQRYANIGVHVLEISALSTEALRTVINSAAIVAAAGSEATGS